MNHFQRYLIDEFAEDYQEGRISRRKALKLIASVTGSLVAAQTILAACAPAVTPPQSTIPATGGPPETLAPTGVGATTPSASPTETAPGSGATVVNTATVGSTATGDSTATVGSTATAEGTSSATGTPPAAGTMPAAGTPGAYGTVTADDPAIRAETVQIPAADGKTLTGYLARPNGDGPSEVILVCHENRGLTDHIRDVTRRVGKAGYTALAVDLLSRSGGTGALNPDDVPGVLGSTSPDQFVQDFKDGVQYLTGQDFARTERVGMMGFCFGGGVTWQVATQMPELLAAVPFYGPPPPMENIPNIQAAVLAIYGELDNRITSTATAVEQAMKDNAKTYQKQIYAGADHAFFNDTGTRFNAQAAQDAWTRTLAWFEQYVRSA